MGKKFKVSDVSKEVMELANEINIAENSDNRDLKHARAMVARGISVTVKAMKEVNEMKGKEKLEKSIKKDNVYRDKYIKLNEEFSKLKSDLDKLKGSDARVKELEKEIAELKKKAKKNEATVSDSIISEKILTDKVESLTGELERLTLSLDEITKSKEICDIQIKSLKANLKASRNRANVLQEKLNSYQ